MLGSNSIDSNMEAPTQKNVDDENKPSNILHDKIINVQPADEQDVIHHDGASGSVDGDDSKLSSESLSFKSAVGKLDSSPETPVKEFDDSAGVGSSESPSKLDEKLESTKCLVDDEKKLPIKTNDDQDKSDIDMLESQPSISHATIESGDNDSVNELSRPNVVRKKDIPAFVGLSEETFSLHQTAIRRIQMLVRMYFIN